MCHASSGYTTNGWAGSQSTRAGVEVGWVEDLQVEVVGSARAAETAATVGHGPIIEEDGNGMVIAGDRRRSQLRKGIGRWIEEFGDVLGRGV